MLRIKQCCGSGFGIQDLRGSRSKFRIRIRIHTCKYRIQFTTLTKNFYGWHYFRIVKKNFYITLDPDPNSKYLDPQQWNEIWPMKSLNHEKVFILKKYELAKKKHMNVIHEKSGARHLSKTSLDILQTMYENALLSASTLCRKKRLMTRQLGQHFCRITAISSKTYRYPV